VHAIKSPERAARRFVARRDGGGSAAGGRW